MTTSLWCQISTSFLLYFVYFNRNKNIFGRNGTKHDHLDRKEHTSKYVGLGGFLCLTTPLSRISVISWRQFICRENRGNRRKRRTCRKSLTNLLYRVHLPWTGFEHTTSVVICTDHIGSYKLQYDHDYDGPIKLYILDNHSNYDGFITLGVRPGDLLMTPSVRTGDQFMICHEWDQLIKLWHHDWDQVINLRYTMSKTSWSIYGTMIESRLSTYGSMSETRRSIYDTMSETNLSIVDILSETRWSNYERALSLWDLDWDQMMQLCHRYIKSSNSIGGVMVSVLASSTVRRWIVGSNQRRQNWYLLLLR